MFRRSILIGLFIIALVGGRCALAEERSAIITYYEGDVKVMRAEEARWVPATLKMDLRPGDKIRTAFASLCEITLEDGSTITIDENTTIDLEELFLERETRVKRSKFMLWFGRLRVRIEKLKKTHFEVESPTGVVGVRGTTWVMGYDDETGITFAAVEVGEVYFRGSKQPEEEEIILRAGEYAESTPDGRSTTRPIRSIPSIEGVTVEGNVAGEDVRIEAEVVDKVPIRWVALFYRTTGTESYSRINMTRMGGSLYEGVIPGAEIRPPGIDFHIMAENEIGSTGRYGTPNSPRRIAIEAPPPPSPPSELQTTAISGTQINLNWQDNSDDEDGFKIERRVEGEDWQEIAMAGVDRTIYSDSLLSPGITYYYRVRAYNAQGDSDYSNQATATTPMPSVRIVRWNLSPPTDFGWYNEPPDLTLNIIGGISGPLESPLIITINEIEVARLWGGPNYVTTITNLSLVSQGRNDLRVTANFEDGQAASVTIPVYFDDIDPIITDPWIDFFEERLTVRIFGESGEEASGIRSIKVNGIPMSTIIQDEEYELVGIDLDVPSILIEAWDKTGVTGNIGTHLVNIPKFDRIPPEIDPQDRIPPEIAPQRLSFTYNTSLRKWQLNVEVVITDIGSGVSRATANGVAMSRSSGDIYKAILDGPFYTGRPIEIIAWDEANNTSEMDLPLSTLPPPPPQS